MSPDAARGDFPFSEADRRQLRNHGIAEAEARRQLDLLRNPPEPITLAAPCTAGDGVEMVTEDSQTDLVERWRGAADAGRILKFVPASGAASRMFATLSRALTELDATGRIADRAAAADCRTLVESLDELPFAAELRGMLAEPVGAALTLEPRTLLRSLLGAGGLDYAQLPKALIPFHREGELARTPIEEQLAEAAALVADADRRCRVHFTIQAGWEPAFRDRSAKLAGDWALEFSVQEAATDTIAMDEKGLPFRSADDTLLLRPGGHGALLGNLDRLGADLVLVKNVDNVQPANRRQTGLHWQRVLVGRLVALQEESRCLIRRLEEADRSAASEAADFLARHFGPRGGSEGAGKPIPTDLIRSLDLPLRVCGMVPNRGETGGGPFWVRGKNGSVTRQIVETAEVSEAAGQRDILAAATHFNPVLLALAVRDSNDRPYDLTCHVDPARAFISRKATDGREFRALEHPGLWNGSMARWNTVFVEVPAATFTPVKTVFDLLRQDHRPC